MFIGHDHTDTPPAAPAGYAWERTPGRPREWTLWRLPLSSPVWVAAREERVRQHLRNHTPRD
jgi:hypothetical protein